VKEGYDIILITQTFFMKWRFVQLNVHS